MRTRGSAVDAFGGAEFGAEDDRAVDDAAEAGSVDKAELLELIGRDPEDHPRHELEDADAREQRRVAEFVGGGGGEVDEEEPQPRLVEDVAHKADVHAATEARLAERGPRLVRPRAAGEEEALGQTLYLVSEYTHCCREEQSDMQRMVPLKYLTDVKYGRSSSCCGVKKPSRVRLYFPMGHPAAAEIDKRTLKCTTDLVFDEDVVDHAFETIKRLVEASKSKGP